MLLISLGMVALGWGGLQVAANSYDIADVETRDFGSVDLPEDLPAPVARYMQAVFVEDAPRVESALIFGRLDMRLNGLAVPGRFKIYHNAGTAYYHYLQATWFGRPIMTIHERFMDGSAVMDLPGAMIENEPTIDAAANQGLWAEAIWTPSVFFTDDRVEWVAIDENIAQLITPDAPIEEAFNVYFDPQTGLISHLTTMRYRDPEDTERTLWTNHMLEWREINGVMIPVVAESQWGTDDPWAVWRVEDVIYNLDVVARMEQFGGNVEP